MSGSTPIARSISASNWVRCSACSARCRSYSARSSVLKLCDRFYSLLTAILATIVITAMLTSFQHLP
ncbi:hypothetical protein [Nostoc sp.]|uniref:hypothetical protein n=1 Tax=Nostoc sp. TaxID=1180 RepID=UPI002FFA5BE8